MADKKSSYLRLSERISEANSKINKDYQESAVRNYAPIIQELMAKADQYMKSYNLDRISMEEIRDCPIVFYSQGHFYDWTIPLGKHKIEGLARLAEAYQNGKGSALSFDRALQKAAEDFRAAIIKSAEDAII
jgi:hypothetical protein